MNKERKTLLETRLRNLKRKHARLMQHADCIDETIEVDREIKSIENKLAMI